MFDLPIVVKTGRFLNPLIRNSSVKSHLAIINVRRLKWWSLSLGPEQKKKKDILNNIYKELLKSMTSPKLEKKPDWKKTDLIEETSMVLRMMST